MDVEIMQHERVDDLQCKGLKLIQDTKGFCFGVDAVLLADFTNVKRGAKVIDLGTGTGIIATLICGKTDAKSVIGLEIQLHIAQMAKRSVLLNNLQDRLSIVCGDLKQAADIFGRASFDNVVCNPPYKHAGTGLVNPHDSKAISRHEIMCTLSDVINSATNLLCPGGKLSMIHRPERLVDIIFLMRQHKLEPKRMRLIHPKPGKKPTMVLVEAAKSGNAFLSVMEPLYVHNDKGDYSEEIYRIYEREKNQNEQYRD